MVVYGLLGAAETPSPPAPPASPTAAAPTASPYRPRSTEALAALRAADHDDPMGEMLALALAGRKIPGISEQHRLANLAKFAATPLLANPYRMAVESIFDAIRDREDARVLDVGIGGGAQMAALIYRPDPRAADRDRRARHHRSRRSRAEPSEAVMHPAWSAPPDGGAAVPRAEGEGLEPSVGGLPHNGFRDHIASPSPPLVEVSDEVADSAPRQEIAHARPRRRA